jgi:hypothetical protein
MLQTLADNRDPASLAGRLRRKRFALFESLLSRVPKPLRILDVGGTQKFWEVMGFAGTERVEVTILNLTPPPISLPNFIGVTGDARDLQFDDASFDIVFSNSVIEHVGGYLDQCRMAREVKRVGARYFLQTPNRYFPIEPHFLFPGFQFLPVPARTWLLQHFSLGWRRRVVDRQGARASVDSIRLLSRSELTALFPEASLFQEKLLGLTKSFVVYAGWS